MEQALAKSVSMKPETILLECDNTVTQYEGLMPLYEEDYKNDAELQSFDATLEAHTKALVTKVKEDGGLSLDVLEQVLTIMTCLGKKTADAVVECKSRMIAMKDKSYKLVLREYLESSLESLSFCNDLEKFLNTARRSHSHIEQKIQECINLGMKLDAGSEEAQMISNILKNLLASNVNDHSGEKLLDKSRCLLEKQKQMLDNVMAAQTKLGEEEERLKGWRKLTNYLYIGIQVMSIVVATLVAGFFFIVPFMACLSSTATAISLVEVLGAPMSSAFVASKVVSVIATGIKHWTGNLFEGFHKVIVDNKNTFNSIEDATDFSTKEMGDLQVLIETVSTQVEALLGIGKDFANGENIRPAIKNIMHYLKFFLEKIEALEKKREKCNSMIMESREAVLI
ncbi:hypothetical protein M0R45_008522 [Rubus argutus]|uniref:Uncharacterized protein n=1 Tax=Rubus argutus TaxID=59490 RepID=A0AAW1Y1H2_RUBAR